MRSRWWSLTAVIATGAVLACTGAIEDDPGDDDLLPLTAAEAAAALQTVRTRALDLLIAHGDAAFATDALRAARTSAATEQGGWFKDASGARVRCSGLSLGDTGPCLVTHFSIASRLGRALLLLEGPDAVAERAAMAPRLARALDVGLTAYDAAYEKGAKANSSPVANWFTYKIGVPEQLAPLALLADAAVRRGQVVDAPADKIADQVERASRILRRPGYMGDVPHALTFASGSHWAGANLMWNTLAHVYLALADRDVAALRAARTRAIEGQVRQVGRSGIQTDGSYHFHASPDDAALARLYIGGYGGEHALKGATIDYLLEGTAFELSPTARRSLLGFIANAAVWVHEAGAVDPAVSGRQQLQGARGGGQALLFSMAIASALREDRPERTAIRDAIARNVRDAARLRHAGSVTAARDDLFAAPYRRFVDAALAAAGEGRAPRGFHFFPGSDYAILRRPGLFAGLKLLSNRLLSGERGETGHALGARQSDGRLLVWSRGDEYVGNGEVLPTLDWTKLPGTTVLWRPDAGDASLRVGGAWTSQYRRGRYRFTGGAALGDGGVTAMLYGTFASGQAKLTARKSQFFFESGIAVLTGGVRCTGCDGRVETIVHQWPLQGVTDAAATIAIGRDADVIERPEGRAWGDGPGEGGEILAGTRWVLADGLGVVFPTATRLVGRARPQSGCWARIKTTRNPSGEEPCPADGAGAARLITRWFLTLWVDHAAGGAAEVAYVLVPGATRATLEAWTNAPPLHVLANDAHVAAVAEEVGDTDRLGAVFWPTAFDAAAARVTWAPAGVVTSSRGSVVQLRARGTTIALAAADPRHDATPFVVTVAKRLRAERVVGCATVTPGATTKIQITSRRGASCVVTLVPDDGRAPTPAEAPEPSGEGADDPGIDDDAMDAEAAALTPLDADGLDPDADLTAPVVP